MQFDPLEHFEHIVVAAVRAYSGAEKRLTAAMKGDGDVNQARYTALREGGAAAIYLHHFADIIAMRGGYILPHMAGDLPHVRNRLAEISEKHLGESHVKLLGDVSDALKHAVLTRGGLRDVSTDQQVLAVGSGFGKGRFGEGKFGGVEEVWVLAVSGPRPLMTVLNSVVRGWQAAFEGE